MKSYRVSVLAMIILAVFVMTDTVKASEKKSRGAARHKQIGHRTKAVKLAKVKRKRSLTSKVVVANTIQQHDKNTDIENAVQHKPLDLAVPFKGLEPSDATGHINSVQENSETTLFTGNDKNTQHALQLKGQVVMSQEPEADKKKSVDGAGIMINLRR